MVHLRAGDRSLLVPCFNTIPSFPVNPCHKVPEILPHTRILPWCQSWFRSPQWAKKTEPEIRTLARPCVQSCPQSCGCVGLSRFWGRNIEIHEDCSRTLSLGKISYLHFHGLQLMRCYGSKHCKWQEFLLQAKGFFPKMIVSRSNRGRKICNIKHRICWQRAMQLSLLVQWLLPFLEFLPTVQQKALTWNTS